MYGWAEVLNSTAQALNSTCQATCVPLNSCAWVLDSWALSPAVPGTWDPLLAAPWCLWLIDARSRAFDVQSWMLWTTPCRSWGLVNVRVLNCQPVTSLSRLLRTSPFYFWSKYLWLIDVDPFDVGLNHSGRTALLVTTNSVGIDWWVKRLSLFVCVSTIWLSDLGSNELSWVPFKKGYFTL